MLVVAQISEVSAFQKSLYDLDRMHHAIKAAYEEDIKRLRHELESRGIPVPPSTNPAAVAHVAASGRKQSLAPVHEGILVFFFFIYSKQLDMNKRLKDANSNPVPSPRYGEHRTSITALKQPPPAGAPPAFQNQYRQGPPPASAPANGPPPQYNAPPQHNRSITPPQPQAQPQQVYLFY